MSLMVSRIGVESSTIPKREFHLTFAGVSVFGAYDFPARSTLIGAGVGGEPW
eukprot:GDKH01007950.1.p2 GENE.GDKH01007950.1~~GDKH01007950.1.p2  ORF type:complete len:52 (-),score=9.47 GDKH01007950.1:52-207(-)